MVIPSELKQLKQWVCWQGSPDPARPGKIKKLPINPYTGGNAQSNNHDTWSDYETALKASGKFSGIGLMFANGYFGVDIDDAENEIRAFKSGDNANIIAEFIYSLESYAEYSQSGKGIHIICKGSLPDGGRRRGKVEMYSEGRFFIMTGKPAAEYGDIIDCTELIKPLHSKYVGREEPLVVKQQTSASLNLDEQEIIDLANNSKQGQAFKTLFDGFWQGLYPSQSEADLAFCNMLAFWCGCDKLKMDSIFRKSSLMRQKWDRKVGNATYGGNTLDRAISDCRDIYSPSSDIADYSITISDPTPLKQFSYDDTGNADRFVDNYKNSVLWSYVNACWYVYTGKKWQTDMTGEVIKLADKLLVIMKKEYAMCVDEDQEKAFNKHLHYTRSNKGKQAMIREIQHRLASLPSDFDKDIWHLNTQNGVLDLKSGQLEEHSSNRMLSKITNTEYSDKIDCPRWKQFLEDIFAGNKELLSYIQKAIGYSLTGSTDEQCMFFCVGNGRNGKSTFLDTISDIFGDYTANIQPETIMIKPYSGAANSDIARLKGARFVTTVEPNEGVRLNEGLVKQLTGGDKVTARFQYGSEFEYSPEFKIWMGTNHKPIIRGRDEGIWRRLHLIPFNVQIPKDKVDKNLKYKLKREYVGILNWAIEGCLLWQQEGLDLPQVIAQAVEEYKGEMDVVTSFLDECTERGVGDIKASDLYQSYKKWALDNGQYVMSSTKFGIEMSGKYDKKKSHGVYKYFGLMLRREHHPYAIDYVK